MAQRLFHARGYDAVSVADLTVLSASIPELLCRFRQQARAVYPRPAARSQTGAIPIDALLRDDQPVAASLIAVLQEAARRHVADPAAAGLPVLEGYIVRMLMPGWRQANGMLRQEPKSSSIARHRPQDALRVTDYMDTLMLPSAKARKESPRLLETVRLAGRRWSASCQPESSDGLSARHLDPLGGYQRLSSRSRLAIIGPISSGTPTRPSAVMAANCAFTSRRPHQPTAKIGGDSAGAMVLTVMPARPARGPCTRSASPQPLWRRRRRRSRDRRRGSARRKS